MFHYGEEEYLDPITVLDESLENDGVDLHEHGFMRGFHEEN